MERNTSALHYAVRVPVVFKYYGQMLFVLAGLLAVPCIVCVGLREMVMALRFALLSAFAGMAAAGLNRLSPPVRIRQNEALAVIVLAFFSAPFLIAVALSVSGLSYIDALFESVSGCTTTGLTVLDDFENASKGLLFTRAWMQWFGGLGISVLSVALITAPGVIGRSLATDMENNDLVGSTRGRARTLCGIFIILTGIVFLTLSLAGLGIFESAVYAMASLSTGGFSPRAASIAGFSFLIQAIISLGCLAGAMPLGVYGRLKDRAWRNPLNRRQAAVLIAATICLMALLYWSMRAEGYQGRGGTWRNAAWLAVSAQTTSGFSSVDVAELSPLSKALLLPAMLVGGSVGSTAGGIKILRTLVLFMVIRAFVRRSGLARHAVDKPRLGGREATDEDVRSACALFSLYIGVVAVSWMAFLAYRVNPMDALFEVTSAVGTVGLSTGVTHTALPVPLKLVLCADMWLGRLEVLAWIVVLSPRTWIGKRTEVR